MLAAQATGDSRRWLALMLGGLLWLLLASSSPAETPPAAASTERSGQAIALTIDGAIGPATASYVEQGLREAAATRADFVLLRIDTPGGLDQAMRDIIQTILASPVPVISYVTPAGARAASAGTYILYASHVAAMTPATNLGAATPVSLGGGGLPDRAPSEPDEKPDTFGDSDESSQPAAPEASSNESAKRNKVVNDAVAYIRGLAERHNRNADWAEEAVRDGASLSASRALELGVIDLVADNQLELLKQLDGRSVKLPNGEQALRTAGSSITEQAPDWRQQLLAVLTNPSVAYMLMMIGIYGLMLEGYSPGALVPGVAGAICLLLALFAFQMLPINYAGLALIALGTGLMVAEAFAPSFGVLGLGGVVAFVVGSVLLMDTSVPGYDIHLGLIAAIATASAGMMFILVWLFARSRKRAVVTGREGLAGSLAEVSEGSPEGGRVFVHGENWRARASRPLQPGEHVRVTAVNGLTLDVEPLDSSAAPQPE